LFSLPESTCSGLSKISNLIKVRALVNSSLSMMCIRIFETEYSMTTDIIITIFKFSFLQKVCPKVLKYLKLILNHQESRTLENHNMFKFRALLGETCLHKKGKQQTYFKCTAQYVWECCSNIANWNKTNDTILKKSLQAPMPVESQCM
jgi:hypothetical protein